MSIAVRIKRTFLSIALACIAGVGCVIALDCIAAEPSSETAERAQSILSAAADYLAAQDSFAFDATVAYEGIINGEQENIVTEYSIAFQDPNKVSVNAKNEELAFLFMSDGERFIRYVPDYAQYTSELSSLTAAEVVSSSGFIITSIGIDIIGPALNLLGQLVRSEPFSGIAETSEFEYVGDESINDVKCHRIRVVTEHTQFDIWIEQGDTPRIRKIQPDMTTLAEQLGSSVGASYEISVTAEISKWEMDAELEERLAFSPPEGVAEVVAFHPPMPAEQLRGKEAPDFTVPLLDGGTLTLSEKKGKIVILDFWATWCGPCRIAMPVLSAVSKEFADDGVLLYGMNLRENKEIVGAYLESSGLDLSIGLDLDGSISNIYKADSIPETVIVDRDGNVAIVHVGLWKMPSRADTAGMTMEEENKFIFDMLADSLREELKGLIGK